MFLNANQVNKPTPLFWVTGQKLKPKQFACSGFPLLCLQGVRKHGVGGEGGVGVGGGKG